MTKPRSVLHLIRPRPAGEIGGADLHILDLATAQQQMGWDVAVASLGGAEYARRLRKSGIEAWDIAGNAMLRWIGPLGRIVRRTAPDVLHSHGYRADMVATALRPSRGSRSVTVMSIHGFIRTGAAMRALTAANELCLRSADAVIATSQQEAARLSRWLPHVTFIPNGVSKQESAGRDYFSAELAVRAPIRVGFIGRLSPEKRPDLFVEMAYHLAAKSKDFGFALIGGGPEELVVRKLIADRGLAEMVQVVGVRQDIDKLLGGLDILVCPSDTEGTPRVIVEAMMTKVPVVATRVGGIPDLIAEGISGRLVAPGSAIALADAVEALVNDPAASASIAGAAFIRASSDFTAEAMCAKTIQVYLNAIGLVD